MLLWALYPENPYGYYMLLRWVCCGVFGVLAVRTLAHELRAWSWMLGATALLYNPILPVHLTRGIWSVLNVASAVLAIVSIGCLPASRGTERDGDK